METRINLGNEIKAIVEQVLVDSYFNSDKIYSETEKATISQIFQNFMISLEAIQG